MTTSTMTTKVESICPQVSQEQFFATVGKLNVHPRAEKEASYWETPERRLMGISTPGYMCERDGVYTSESRFFTLL